MQNSKLYYLFQSIRGDDIRRLRRFLHSPYFNSREDVVRLFEYLHANEAEGALLTKEAAFAHLFPGTTYDDGRMNAVMHFLFKLLKQFLVQREFELESSQPYLTRALRKRKLPRLFEPASKKWKKQLDKAQVRNAGYHFQQYQYQLEKYEYEHRQRRSGRMNLQEITEALTTYYLADILRHGCAMLTAKNISQEAYELDLMQEVLRYLDRTEQAHQPAVAVYHQAFLSLSDLKEPGHFTELLRLIELHWQQFPPSEARDLYLLAINYCIQKLNRGDRAYIRRALELYQLALDRALLIEEGVLSQYTYNNILMLAIGLQEWSWGRQFLEDYRSALPAMERENLYRYNLATLHFRQGAYAEAMELLRRVTFSDVLYNLNARTMLLRTYYELEEYDALFALLDSFEVYIRRQKGMGYHRSHYQALLQFTRRLLHLPEGDKDGRAQLKADIQAAPATAERAWLLSKLE
ncbi:MAG: hypothetical protein RIC19_00070 [Phaeodactylibacter sp.]|uniref:hypothetical protein n=1 Tax=Phaeodactylibacter sp. TaxID=1940289 RepID=UPI0032EDECFE